jgi:osmoprotectant transport system permease protein
MRFISLTLILLLSVWAASGNALVTDHLPIVTVGSKTFTESYVLAEIISQIIEANGEATVDRRFGMGATGILAEALRTGAVDLYPEYSGTISEVILKSSNRQDETAAQLREELAPRGLTISDSLGFDNTYAVAVDPAVAQRFGLKTISDLRRFPDLRYGLSYEFVNRSDGFSALARAYGLRAGNVHAMEHSLAYQAMGGSQIDVMDVYSTDAKISEMGLTILKDDRHFFPAYHAVLLARQEFVSKFPRTWAALRKRLENGISVEEMQHLNEQADLKKESFVKIAASFLRPGENFETSSTNSGDHSRFSQSELWRRTREHLFLVLSSLFAAICLGVPLGIISSRFRKIGELILVGSGVFQTIPSLALLCFLIPVFGVGNPPAMIALFLYALLPIVSNTYLGLSTLDPEILDSEKALGLSSWQRLVKIEIPLASPSLISGIRTSTIITIGTATLAALIGAGGYGVPIVTGLALNDIPVILSGAIPAAVLAIIAYGGFSLVSRWLVPKGIR